MKKIKSLFVFLVLSVIYVACTKDDGGGDGGIFIPDYSQQWVNAANDSNKYFIIRTVDHDTNQSDLNGNEYFFSRIDGSDSAVGSFSGSFLNHDISFTYVNGAKTGETYKGRINDASTQITFTNELVLNKQ